MNTSALHVLIVDDENSVRINLATFLEDEGFIVHAAATAEETLHIAATEKIDVSIIDLRLPDMDGETLILNLYTLQPETKFLIHTGSPDYALSKKLSVIGINSWQVFIKPLKDMNVLVQAIEYLKERKGVQP